MSTPTRSAATVGQDGRVADLTYREAIIAALDDELAADPAVLLMGEDVASSGGVFKTSDGLVERYGPSRVINTPICENGFVCVALGMALAGLRPVVEIMFSDFLPTAGDAITNQLPKYRFMSGGRFSVPVTVRSIGGGTGGFGTQHSATGESWFLGLPGLRIATASSPAAAYAVLRAAIRHDNPVLFFEHKGLYGRKGPVQRGIVARVGEANVVRAGADVTIVGTLLMVERSLAAAERLASEGIDAEVLDLCWLRPLPIDAVARSVERTGRLVVVEEQVHAGGWGATLISELAQRGVAWASPPRAVSMPPDMLVPYSPPLEVQLIPSVGRIVESARAAVGQP